MPEIVYEDNHLLVSVKPPNQLTQSDATGDTALLDELKTYIAQKYQKPGAVYLGLVHRLDRPVGGLVAFARTSKAASRLSEQIRTRAMKREYLAVVCDQPERPLPDAGTLHDYLLSDEQSDRTAVYHMPHEGAKEAVLHYTVLERNPSEHSALVHVCLETGRKHQIRAQMSAAGYPLMYDMRYGNGIRGHQIALWGAVLRLTHPTLKTVMTFVSEPKSEAFRPYLPVIRDFLSNIANCEDSSL